ncbi:hybrid sensor histidine kinase/response regulator [Cupriavidus plantarum]|nr:Sensor histidine kinase RcsC [Cupriavidus plantarum]SMR85713.1 PAS domain S-box-containing protein [Cupriavidus plantarum]
MASALDDAVCCVVVTEEELRGDLRPLSAWVASQPPWSDLPFIVLTRRVADGGDRSDEVARMTESLGNVTFVERPFHPTTFVSVIGAAVRARQRQFQARKSLEALHEGEERLRTALTAGHLGSWELDVPTEILTASATCKAIFGRAEDEDFTYADALATTHPDDRQHIMAALARSIETGADYALEHRLIWPDGSVRTVDARARYLRGGASGTGHFVGVCLDVTDRVAAEEQLRRANESLEKKVRERTAELEASHRGMLEEIRRREQTEDKLRHVQKLELIGQLSGGIAHDFNNLLAAILGNLELARKEAASNLKLIRLIDGAQQGARRGAALTQRLLAAARQQDLNVAPTSLARLVRGMEELITRSIGPAFDLRIDAPDSAPPALVDANQIELALLNLVVNSRDAMPRGGRITIAVDTRETAGDPELPAGEYVRVTVSDQGVGMDAATLAKAGEPFFTTKEIGKGTGLGLSMIRGLARQLKGALRLESEPGRGTRATLWLPALAKEAIRAWENTARPVAPAHATVAPVAQADAIGRILVVDDDSLVATSTALLLEDAGHEVVSADSGDAALELLASDMDFDVLLTDYSMPQMTGTELASAARLLRPGLSIILATGYAEVPDTDTSVLHLRKPFRLDQLVTQVNLAIRYARRS